MDRAGLCGCGCYEEYEFAVGHGVGRWRLEALLAALPRNSRRELATVVGVLDTRLLASTYGSEPDGPGWWQRRL
jgi:hypothetical protein